MAKRVWLLILSVVLGCSLLLVSPVNAQGGDVCEQPNVLNAATCRFPGRVTGVAGYGAVRQGWNAFIAQGSPTFDGETHNGYDPEVGKDQHIFGSVPWAAGVWQHVNGTAPGNGYRLTVGWFVSTNCVGARGRVGIDPTGGDNPNSPNIVWSDKFSVCASKAGHKSVQAIAQSGRVSIWVWAEIDRTCGCGDQIWVTAVALTGDASVPTATPPPPTDTPRPPTPTRVPPTRTFTPVPATNTPAPTATALPTNTPAATATATATTTPLPTDTPSPTEPIVPVVAIRRVTPTPTAKPSSLLPSFDDAASTDWLAVGLLGFAGCTFALAILVGVGMVAFWFWRRQ
jgi:hypothetical protein